MHGIFLILIIVITQNLHFANKPTLISFLLSRRKAFNF